MKKYVFASFMIALSCLLLASCGKTDATKRVISMIKDIGSDVGLDSDEAISMAQAAYDMLSDEEKAKVNNYNKLTDAADKYEKLVGLNDYISQAVNSADTTFSKDGFNVSGMLDQYDEMVSLYDSLSDSDKAQIQDFDKLEAAMQQMQKYDDAAQEAAAAYAKGFMEVYKGYTITAIGCIKQIRDEKEYHFFSLTYKDKEGNEHNAYSTARFVGSNVINTIIARPDLFFAEAPATEETDCLKNGNVTIDVAAALKTAKDLKVEAPATTAPAATEPAATTEAATTEAAAAEPAAATEAATTAAAAETTTAA